MNSASGYCFRSGNGIPDKKLMNQDDEGSGDVTESEGDGRRHDVVMCGTGVKTTKPVRLYRCCHPVPGSDGLPGQLTGVYGRCGEFFRFIFFWF